jgi:hypothetical protein
MRRAPNRQSGSKLIFLQERELEKVNAFYLQKEAEACAPHLRPLRVEEEDA